MFNILKKSFGKTTDTAKKVVSIKRKEIPKEEFEEVLLEADVNYGLIERLLETLPETISRIQAFNSLISVFQYKADWKENDVTPYVEIV
ncbi:MAG: signal recognition particle-docking protein FtsY, partial [Sulfurovum sp.]|nr:signal recognition particle-docking protein FtsY [Sulfurovum sp.]